MADKARNIMQRTKLRKLFQNHRLREKVLEEFNRSTLDDMGPMGGEQGTELTSEMNSRFDDHEEFVKSLAPSVNVP